MDDFEILHFLEKLKDICDECHYAEYDTDKCYKCEEKHKGIYDFCKRSMCVFTPDTWEFEKDDNNEKTN